MRLWGVGLLACLVAFALACGGGGDDPVTADAGSDGDADTDADADADADGDTDADADTDGDADPHACADLFAQDVLPEWQVEVSDEDWADIRNEYVNWEAREAEGLAGTTRTARNRTRSSAGRRDP